MAANSSTDAVVAITLALVANIPLGLRGAPGTGKTSLLRSIAYSLGWALHTSSAPIHDSTDFSGLPFLSATATARTMRAPLEWAYTLDKEVAKHGGNGLLFFDDVAFAPPAVQNALLQIVLERRVDQFQLPAGVRCAASLDEVAMASTTWALTAPLANRMIHLSWSPDASWWTAGFLSGWRLDLPPLPEDWEHYLPATRAKVAAFIRFRPELLHDEPKDKDAQGGPWPSGRTWDMLSRLLAACDAAGASADVRLLLTTGAVGEGAGVEYLSWEREAHLPDPEAPEA